MMLARVANPYDSLDPSPLRNDAEERIVRAVHELALKTPIALLRGRRALNEQHRGQRLRFRAVG